MVTKTTKADPSKAQPAKKAAKQPAPTKTQKDALLDPLAAVVTRNNYYRDGFRNLLKIALFEGVAIIGLVIALVAFINTHQPTDRFFATTSDGRLVQMIALDQPNLNQPALMSWVAQASTEVMTFGFHDYKRRLQEASRHFTRDGWESFTTALQQSRILESLEAQQQVITAVPRSAPVLVQEGLLANGRYFWRVALPLSVTYQSGTKTRTDYLRIEITIVRVPTLENPIGVGIDQWIAVLG